MSTNFRAALAEFIGTFTLVFIGAGAVDPNVGVLGVAWAHGLALMVIVYAWGSISGAHVNPAVTFGVALAGRMDWIKAILYWAAQILGAIAAAYLLKFLFGPDGKLGETVGKWTPFDNVVGEPLKVIVLEAVLTFFLVVAVFASGVQGRNGNAAGVAIGLVLTMDIIMGGNLTGASMNPARTIGPALAMNHLGYVWLYVVGPLIGGGIGGLVYDRIFTPSEPQPPASRS